MQFRELCVITQFKKILKLPEFKGEKKDTRDLERKLFSEEQNKTKKTGQFSHNKTRQIQGRIGFELLYLYTPSRQLRSSADTRVFRNQIPH